MENQMDNKNGSEHPHVDIMGVEFSKRVYRVLDLCCGLGGATAAFRAAGCEVITVDIDPRFQSTIVSDVNQLSGFDLARTYGNFDLVWASPPCTEFSKRLQPWFKDIEPDLTIYKNCKRIISEINPVYWVIENVRGAVKYFGPTRQTIEPFYLWGNFPPIGGQGGQYHCKSQITAGTQQERAALRACVPYRISVALCAAVMGQGRLF